jgi:hypothetical protein
MGSKLGCMPMAFLGNKRHWANLNKSLQVPIDPLEDYRIG